MRSELVNCLQLCHGVTQPNIIEIYISKRINCELVRYTTRGHVAEKSWSGNWCYQGDD